ncbi:MAG: YihY/virulence factor BrkB family protein [Chitinophagaceae bacterium]
MSISKSGFTFLALTHLIKDSLKELVKNDPLRMAGATAFFTSFALPPILIILIQVLGLAYDEKTIAEEFYESLKQIVGKASAVQVVQTLTAVRKMANSWYMTIGGFVFLVFVSTTLFKVIKGSLNQLWRIRVIKKRSIFIRLSLRLKSFFVIVTAGVLFLAGLLADAARAFLGKYVYQLSPALTFYFNSGLSYFLSVIIVTLWFAIVFRYLPDGRPVWKVTLVGAAITSLLFNTGKLILHWLLIRGNMKEIYGASGSVVLLLLFVFYSSLILYFGAAFTKVWGAFRNKPIQPLPHAIHYRLAEMDDDEVEV